MYVERQLSDPLTQHDANVSLTYVHNQRDLFATGVDGTELRYSTFPYSSYVKIACIVQCKIAQSARIIISPLQVYGPLIPSTTRNIKTKTFPAIVPAGDEA